jgi:hypothetical protein
MKLLIEKGVGSSFDPAETVKELLDCAKRRVVHLFAAIEQPKMHAKLLMRRLRIVPNNLQTAALGWPFWPESADD